MKIPTLFVRDDATELVTDEVTPGCEWVIAGEGLAVRYYGGVCARKDENGEWWIEGAGGPEWIRAEYSTYRWPFEEALEASPTPHVGTYELCAPNIKGNPEGLSWPGLVYHKHGQRLRDLDTPGTFQTYEWLRHQLTAEEFTFEGVVWHHRSGDGRMAKLKPTDFVR